MSVAKVVELSATSSEGFDEAVAAGIAKASETLRGITGAWVKEQKVEVADGRISAYQVNLQVTFVLE